jgi:hypothetical protein
MFDWSTTARGMNFHPVLEHDPRHAEASSALGRVEFEQKRYNHAIHRSAAAGYGQ